MTARLTSCPGCGREISKMAQGCQECGRTHLQDAYDEEDYFEEKKSRWPFRLLFLLLSPVLAIGGFLLVVGEALLGFGLVVGGVGVLPSHAVLAGAFIAFGVGLWIVMIDKGLDAAFGKRRYYFNLIWH